MNAAKTMVFKVLGVDDTISERRQQELSDSYITGDKKFARLVDEVKTELEQRYNLFNSEVMLRKK